MKLFFFGFHVLYMLHWNNDINEEGKKKTFLAARPLFTYAWNIVKLFIWVIMTKRTKPRRKMCMDDLRLHMVCHDMKWHGIHVQTEANIDLFERSAWVSTCVRVYVLMTNIMLFTLYTRKYFIPFYLYLLQTPEQRPCTLFVGVFFFMFGTYFLRFVLCFIFFLFT